MMVRASKHLNRYTVVGLHKLFWSVLGASHAQVLKLTLGVCNVVDVHDAVKATQQKRYFDLTSPSKPYIWFIVILSWFPANGGGG